MGNCIVGSRIFRLLESRGNTLTWTINIVRTMDVILTFTDLESHNSQGNMKVVSNSCREKMRKVIDLYAVR